MFKKVYVGNAKRPTLPLLLESKYRHVGAVAWFIIYVERNDRFEAYQRS